MMNSSNIALFSISNSIGSYIIQKFNLDPVHASSIGILLMYVLDGFKFEFWHGILSFLIYIGWYIYKNKNGDSEKLKTSSIKLCNIEDINELQTYMKEYKDFFDKFYDTILGNLDTANSTKDNINVYHKSKFLETNQKIKFNDTNFNVSGFIEIEIYSKDIGDDKKKLTIDIKYPVIYIYRNSNMRADIYYEKMKEQNATNFKEKNNITLYYTKVIFDKGIEDFYNHKLVFYEGPKNNLDQRKQECMDTFYHQQKNYLLSFIDKIQNHSGFFRQVGQTGQFNMLLHGPPGTGKSTFVYRLAMSTNRHIISIDLNNVVHKRNAYQIIQNPYNKDMKPSEYIILFEEFDNVVLNLKEKETSKYKLNNKKEDSNDTQTYKQIIENIIDDFELNDLLEIFQGPVPREGQIIIATTNKYDDIKEICPALFRPGRLTPIEFGYMTHQEVNKLSNLYFGRNVDIKFNPQIPTSKIIEIALYAKLINDPEYFVQELNKNN